MAGLVPAIHVLLLMKRVQKDVDARAKRGHDGVTARGMPAAISAFTRVCAALCAGMNAALRAT